MTTDLNLGDLDGPVLIFGGPYSNLQALQALLAKAEALGIPPRRMICTGDIVAYCAQPQETVDGLRQSGIRSIQGNCEQSLAANADDCGCGFAEGSTCDVLSAHWFTYASASLDEAARAWMGTLPERIRFTLGGRRLAVVHGAPSAINTYVFASSPPSEKSQQIEAMDCDGVICGHSGLPFSEIIGDRLWHNAGVIGLPANDGTPRVWYSLLTPDADGLTIEHKSLDYDFTAAAAAMRQNRLPEEYAATLASGLWDNCDILPAPETAQQGEALKEVSLNWPQPEDVRDRAAAE